MKTADSLDDEIGKTLYVEPPAHLEARLVERIDDLRAVHVCVRKEIKTALALRFGFALVIVALVNGLTPRVLLGPVGRLLNHVDHWSLIRHLPEQLLTVYTPTVLAALFIVAGLIGRAFVDASTGRSAS